MNKVALEAPRICRHRRQWIWRSLPFLRHIGQVPWTPATGLPHCGISVTWSGHGRLFISPTDERLCLNESEIKRSRIYVFRADRTRNMTSPGIVRNDWWYFWQDVKCSFAGWNLHVSTFQWICLFSFQFLLSNKRFVKVGNENKLRFDLPALNLSWKCTYMYNI